MIMSALISLLVFAVAVAASWSLLQGSDPWRSWRTFAERQGMSVVVPVPGGDPQMSGVWRGLRVRVVCRQDGGVAGEDPAIETRFQAMAPLTLPLALTVRPREPGAPEPEGAVPSGDDTLDALLIFRCGEPEVLAELLADANVRAAWAALVSRHPEALLEDGALRFSLPDRVMEPLQLEGALDDLVEPLRAMVKSAGAREGVVMGVMAGAGGGAIIDVEAVSSDPRDAATTADAELLRTLSDGGLSDPERQLKMDAMGDGLMVFTLVAQRVGASTGLLLPVDYRGGRTLYAAAEALEVSVRFPSRRDDELDDVEPGETLRVRARVVGWDALTRRLTLEAP